jgi:hypothetical protein
MIETHSVFDTRVEGYPKQNEGKTLKTRGGKEFELRMRIDDEPHNKP